MILEEHFKEAVREVLKDKFPHIESLSDQQHRALFNLVLGKDVFAILPTGSGKSLIFQMAPAVILSLRGKAKYDLPEKPILIIICPLNSLIDSHIRELKSRGFRASSLTTMEDEKDILSGEVTFVFCNPESIIKNQKWRGMVSSEVYLNNLIGFVTDEVHVVPKWGSGNAKEKTAAFRDCFSRLGELRSLGPQVPLAPVLALTATATKKVQKMVLKTLAMRQEYTHIEQTPNRPNIYLFKARVGKTFKSTFSFLLEKLKIERQNMERTLVYCKSIKHCAELYSWFKVELGKDSYYPTDAENISINCLFSMFHHCTSDRIKNQVLESLHSPSGTCRLVFSTNALGMGVNFKDIRMVIHYGPPRSLDDYLQEIGRAGRDGLSSTAVLFYNGNFVKRVDGNTKKFCLANESTSCLRTQLLQEFDLNPIQPSPKHLCCVSCHKQCLCAGECCSQELPKFNLYSNTPINNSATLLKQRTVTLEDKDLLKELLIDYQLQLTGECSSYYLQVQCTTGFSDTLIQMILSKAKFIFNLDYIEEHLPVFNRRHALDILHMFSDVFDDIEENSHELEAELNSSFVSLDCDKVGKNLPSYFFEEESNSEDNCSQCSNDSLDLNEDV